MIQVSPPIHTERPETIPPEGPGAAESIPKDKWGVFAKLLEGLIHGGTGAGKARTAPGDPEPGNSGDPPDSGDLLGPEDPAGLADPAALAGLPAWGAPAGPEDPALEDPPALADPLDPEDPAGRAGLLGLAGLAALDDPAGPAGSLGRAGSPAGEDPPGPAGSPALEDPAGLADPLAGEDPAGRGAPFGPFSGPFGEEVLAGGSFPAGQEGDRTAADARKLRDFPEFLFRTEGRSGSPAGEAPPARGDPFGSAAPVQKDAPGPRRNEGREKRRERLSLEVRDYREAPQTELPREAFSGPARPADSREVELRLELPQGRGPSPERGAAESAGNFENLLAGELRGTLGEDIIRQAALILRDGGSGLIRLALKPESLGTVKIRLEMAENKVSGRIIVESDEVLRAFEREIQTLEQAFRDSGFDGASIEMAISSGNGGEGRERHGQEEGRPFFAGRERVRQAAADYDSSAALAAEEFLAGDGIPASSRRPVNMLV